MRNVEGDEKIHGSDEKSEEKCFIFLARSCSIWFSYWEYRFI